MRASSPFFLFIIFILSSLNLQAQVKVGVENLFSLSHQAILHDKKIGLITNHTALDSKGRSTIDLLKQNAQTYHYSLVALFGPEHGIDGVQHAGKNVDDARDSDGIPIYSLHGATRRPTAAMLKNINLLIYDIQDVGCRSYTYLTTLFYAMEEAAKAHIPVVVLDRPNPLGGLLVDGPMLEDEWRSFVGYINVPYCHGLTVGELARFFNAEYKVGCDLVVIPMQGWQRSMTFAQTGLTWVPTSPQIPEAQTPFYYPTTGILGELQIVNIGVGYTLPFKVVGAPWINAQKFAEQLNKHRFPGVRFQPFHYSPFFGRFAGQNCHGVLIVVTDPHQFLPVTTQFLLIGVLKTMYPTAFQKGLEESSASHEIFHKVCGTAEVYRLLKEEPFVVWKLRGLHQKEREFFIRKRSSYFHPAYS